MPPPMIVTSHGSSDAKGPLIKEMFSMLYSGYALLS